jgi:phosphate-selective porin OprO/OprP
MRVGYRTLLAAGGSVTALLWASSALAARPSAVDARIAKLEAAVAALQAQVQADEALMQGQKAQIQAQTDAVAENAALKDQVGDLTAQIADLKTSTATQIKSLTPTGPAPTAVATYGKDSSKQEVGIASADGKFSLNLYALVQLDSALYEQREPGPLITDFRRSGPALGFNAGNVDLTHARKLKDGTEFRRARFGFQGNAFGDFQYRVVADFGGSGVENAGQLYEAWAQYNGFKPLKIRIGAFAPQVGLADQDSTAAQPLLDRPASTDVARGLGAGDTRIAAQLFANGSHWLASAAVTGRTIGVANSAALGTPQTYGDQLALVGRLAATPLYGHDWRVHLGVHGTYVARTADTAGPANSGASPANRTAVAFSDTPELRVDATKLINTGNIDAKHADSEGVELAAQWRSLLFQSEYDHFHVERLAAGVTNPHFDGYYFEGSWVVTGEARQYNAGNAAFDGPAVRHPFGKDGGMGAVELTLRYSDMDLNYHAGAHGAAPALDAIRGGESQIWTAGINWWLNAYVRIALEGQDVRIIRLSPDPVNLTGPYQTPLGAEIGQHYNTVAVRTQVGF